MKKILIIVITAMLILTACTGGSPSATPIPQTATPAVTPIATAQPTDTPDPDATPEITATPTMEPTVMPAVTEEAEDSLFSLPQTIVDEGNINIVLEDVIDSDEQTVELLFNIANDTGDAHAFFVVAISINNIVIPLYSDAKHINAGEEGYYAFTYSKYTIAEYGIEEIADIQFNYSVANVDKSTTPYHGTFHLEGGENFDVFDITQGTTLIASNEYIDVYWLRAYADSYQDEYYEYIIKNKNDITLNLHMTGIAINGISASAAQGYVMLPNSIVIHRGYVSGAESSFLTDVGSVQKVDIEFSGHDRLTGANQFELKSGYVFVETPASNTSAEIMYDGQIIYNIDDLTIGIKKIYDDNNACNQFEIYIANDKESTAYISITDVLLDDGPVGNDYKVAVLPGTYAKQIITLDDYIGDEQYEMSLRYGLRFSYTATSQIFGLSFILE